MTMGEYDDLDDAALEKAMVEAAMGEAVVRPGTPLNDSDKESTEQTPEPAPEPETPAEPPAEVETPEKVEEPPSEPVPDEDAAAIRERELEARIKHFESVNGRLGGELGFVKQQLKALMEQRASVPTEEPDDAPQETRRAEPPRQDQFAAWAIKQSVESAGARFQADHPDYVEHAPKIKDYLAERGIDASGILLSNDPEAAYRQTQQLLTEHYWHVRATAEETRRAQLLTRKAEQTAAAATAKKKAGIAASGSAPPPKPKSKTVDEMSIEELEAALARETGGRW